VPEDAQGFALHEQAMAPLARGLVGRAVGLDGIVLAG
jgi:hypothetical protein